VGVFYLLQKERASKAYGTMLVSNFNYN